MNIDALLSYDLLFNLCSKDNLIACDSVDLIYVHVLSISSLTKVYYYQFNCFFCVMFCLVLLTMYSNLGDATVCIICLNVPFPVMV